MSYNYDTMIYINSLYLDREINLEVFTILNTGMITVADLDTEQNTKVSYVQNFY